MSDTGEKLFCIVTGTNAYGSGVAYSNVTEPVVGAASSVVASTSKQGAGPGSFATNPIDTTGATLLVVGVASYAAYTTVTDNKGNTWTASANYPAPTVVNMRFYYCLSPTVGTNHIITFGGDYSSATFVAFSGPARILDLQVGGQGTGATASAGSGITPTAPDALVISLIGHYPTITASSAISSSGGTYTVVSQLSAIDSLAMGHSFAYLVQAAAIATDPDWTLGASTDWTAAIASFKSA